MEALHASLLNFSPPQLYYLPPPLPIMVLEISLIGLAVSQK